jgi:hypothetical protein
LVVCSEPATASKSLAVASEERSVATRRVGSNGGTGLAGARIDLVNRYLAAAHGPPPRAPLRSWIGGEWVEMGSPEPEALPQAGGVQIVCPVSSGVESTVGPLPAPVGATATPRADQGSHPPTYDWISEYRNSGIAPIVRERLLPLMQPGRGGSRPYPEQPAA